MQSFPLAAQEAAEQTQEAASFSSISQMGAAGSVQGLFADEQGPEVALHEPKVHLKPAPHESGLSMHEQTGIPSLSVQVGVFAGQLFGSQGSPGSPGLSSTHAPRVHLKPSPHDEPAHEQTFSPFFSEQLGLVSGQASSAAHGSAEQPEAASASAADNVTNIERRSIDSSLSFL